MTRLFSTQARLKREAEAPKLTHTERCNRIMDEMRVISRNEWFQIAKRGKPGLPGFSPMRQLQLKIRDNPLTFVPEILGFFVMPAGEILERLVPWPNTRWRVAHKFIANNRTAERGLDMFPYLRIDPLIDALDEQMTLYGIEDPRTTKAARALIDLCIKVFGHGHTD